MKTIILSDTHLTDHFDLDLYQALKTVVLSADQVIINGDFWDGYLVTFDQFVNSQWQTLFPLLKRKKTIYIYGNHDSEALCDQRVQLFSVQQGLTYSLAAGSTTYMVQHGHLIHQSPITNVSALFPVSWIKGINVWIKRQEEHLNFVGQLTIKIESYFDKVGDKKLRAYVSKIGANQPDMLYVCGHTHTVSFSTSDQYLNPGRFTAHNLGYLQIQHDGRAKVVLAE